MGSKGHPLLKPVAVPQNMDQRLYLTITQDGSHDNKAKGFG